MTSKLAGTVAIVTGASSGIGEATAKEARIWLGASVAVIARRKNRLDTLVADIEEAGGTALAVEGRHHRPRPGRPGRADGGRSVRPP